MTSLFVIAGGKGTRLQSVVSDVPKPLAPVNGTPMLHYLLENWVRQGVTEFVFLLHHQAELICAFIRQEQENGLLQGLRVELLIEPEPMGTGGAIAYGVKKLNFKSNFLATNADSWLGTGIQELSRSPVPAIATLQVSNTQRYGSVVVEGDKITEFREKHASPAASGLINAGLYHLSPTLFASWNGTPFSIETDLFPQLVKSGQLHATRLETDFIDIGIPEDYARFCQWKRSGNTCPLQT